MRASLFASVGTSSGASASKADCSSSATSGLAAARGGDSSAAPRPWRCGSAQRRQRPATVSKPHGVDAVYRADDRVVGAAVAAPVRDCRVENPRRRCDLSRGRRRSRGSAAPVRDCRVENPRRRRDLSRSRGGATTPLRDAGRRLLHAAQEKPSHRSRMDPHAEQSLPPATAPPAGRHGVVGEFCGGSTTRRTGVRGDLRARTMET